jgi:HSP20 family protein
MSNNDVTTTQNQTRQADANQPALLPPVDVIEDASGITLVADMPGVAKDGLHLRVEGDQLALEGDLSIAVPEGTEPSHAEVQLSRYRRTFTLSKELDPEKVSAEFNQGVLRVRIPKAQHAQPRKISVNVG